MKVQDRIENQPGRFIAVHNDKNRYKYYLADTTYKYFSVPRDSSTNVGTYGASCTNEYGPLAEATVTAYLSPEIAKIDPLLDDGLCEDIVADIIAQTCKTAREGVERIAEIKEKDGSSECNIIMLADQQESWYVECYSGHQWAVKMPDEDIVMALIFMKINQHMLLLKNFVH